MEFDNGSYGWEGCFVLAIPLCIVIMFILIMSGIIPIN
jgi:hypothetical protein